MVLDKKVLAHFRSSATRIPLSPGNADVSGKRDIQTATAVILLTMAKANGHFSFEVGRQTIREMRSAFRADFNSVLNVLLAADAVRRDPDALPNALALLDEKLTREQKRSLLAMIYSISLADGQMCGKERELAHHMAHIVRDIRHDRQYSPKSTEFIGFETIH